MHNIFLSFFIESIIFFAILCFKSPNEGEIYISLAAPEDISNSVAFFNKYDCLCNSLLLIIFCLNASFKTANTPSVLFEYPAWISILNI